MTISCVELTKNKQTNKQKNLKKQKQAKKKKNLTQGIKKEGKREGENNCTAGEYF
jgi:hypothetical protein